MKKTWNNLYHLEIFMRNRENRGGCVVNGGNICCSNSLFNNLRETYRLRTWMKQTCNWFDVWPENLNRGKLASLSKNLIRLSRFILYLWKRISFSLNSKNSLGTMNSFSLFPTISIRRIRAWRCHVIESSLVKGPLNSVLLFEKE